MHGATPFRHQSATTPEDSAIWQRARQFCAPTRFGLPVLVPSEFVSAIVIDLPAAPARQRAAMLTYAIEEKIAQPIESVVVAQARLPDAPPGRVLAFVIAKDLLDALVVADPTSSTAMPDMLLIRRPEAPATGTAWAVWREGTRAVVRVSDGTGFAINVDMLAMVWARAGKPILTSLGAALPTNLPAVDLSAAPPDPDPAELTFRFAKAASQADRSAGLRPLIVAGVIALTGMAIVLGLALADSVALGRIAATQQATAQAALSGVLPGVTLGPDVGPILSRLAPVTAPPEQGKFLPLLAAVSAALSDAGPAVTFRRLTWSETDNRLTLNLQAAGLDDLQTIQQHLTATGFALTSGAATAGDGGAEVDLSITRAAP